MFRSVYCLLFNVSEVALKVEIFVKLNSQVSAFCLGLNIMLAYSDILRWISVIEANKLGFVLIWRKSPFVKPLKCLICKVD